MEQSGHRRTRDMEMKFLFQCPRCAKEKAIHYEVPLIEDDKYVYAQWLGQSGAPHLKRLPVVDISIDEEGHYTVEDFFTNLGGGKSESISGERLREEGLLIECPYCGEKTQFVLAAGIIRDREGSVLMQKVMDTPAVYGSPIVLLGSDKDRNLNVVSFLNPVSESHETTQTSELEVDGYRTERFAVDEDEIVQERATEMITESNAAIQSNPDDVEAYYKRAMAYMLGRDYDSAFEDLSTAIQLKPGHTPAITKRGIIYGGKEQFDLAMKDFNRAIELDPNYPPAYLNRGICYYEIDNTALALKDLNKVLEISTEPVLVKQARQYSIMCKRKDSLRECEKGTAYIGSLQYEEATMELRRVIECNPGNATAYFYLGMAYDNQENYDLAVAALDQVIELDPEFPGAHNNRGWVYLKTAHYTQAIADFTKEISFNPDFVVAYLNRANAYHNTEQYGLAVADLKKALKLSTDPEQRAKIQRQLGRYRTDR